MPKKRITSDTKPSQANTKNHLNFFKESHIHSQYKKPSQAKTGPNPSEFKAMDNHIHRDLIDGHDSSSDSSDEDDESHLIYTVNAILNGTARLNVLLPTATILAFTIFAPLLSNDGTCATPNRWMMGFFIALCAGSCVFFAVTDSFKTASGRLHYGVATKSGIWAFNGVKKRPRVASDYRLRWSDLCHVSFSLVAFLGFAGCHGDVVGCYYPALPRRVTNTLPLVVGFMMSVLFVVFPSKRRGIGYPFLLQKEALYSRC